MAVERVEGVEDAEFSYERGEGFVAYDPSVTNVEAIVAELKRMTGFEATERATMEGDHVSSGGAAGGTEEHAHDSTSGDGSHR